MASRNIGGETSSPSPAWTSVRLTTEHESSVFALAGATAHTTAPRTIGTPKSGEATRLTRARHRRPRRTLFSPPNTLRAFHDHDPAITDGTGACGARSARSPETEHDR